MLQVWAAIWKSAVLRRAFPLRSGTGYSQACSVWHRSL